MIIGEILRKISNEFYFMTMEDEQEAESQIREVIAGEITGEWLREWDQTRHLELGSFNATDYYKDLAAAIQKKVKEEE